MRYKKIMIATTLLASMNLLALNKVSTGGDLSFTFAPIVENTEKNISNKNFAFKNGSYHLKLVDLELNFEKYGLKLGTTVKSSREDLRLNDFDLKYKYGKDLELTDEMVSHDIMPKIYIEYGKKFKGLNFLSSLQYYVDNFWDQTRQLDESTNEITELSKPYEYLEDNESDEEEQKQKLGNTRLHSELKGTIEGTKTDIDLSFDYKANQFYRFDKDKSYFKLKADVNSTINDEFKVGTNYSFDTDLHFASKPFDQFDHDIDYGYPDFVAGNYVQNIDQEVGAYVDYSPKTIKDFLIKTKLDAKIKTWLIGYENKTDSLKAIWNKVEPTLSIEVSKKVYDGLQIVPNINLGFEIQNTKYLNQNNVPSFTEAAFNPMFGAKLQYSKEIEKQGNYSNDFSFSYGPKMTIATNVTDLSELKHIVELKDKFSSNHKFNDKLELKTSVDSYVKIPILNGENEKIESKLDTVASLEYKINEKMKIDTKIENKFSSNSENKILNPTDLKNRVEFMLGYKYDVLEKKEKDEVLEKLEYSNKLVVSNNTQFDYYIESYKPINDENPTTDDEVGKKRNLIYKGYSRPVQSTNQFKFNNNLKYTKKINEKLSLNTSLDTNTDLYMLALNNNRLHSKSSEELDKDKMNPIISDYRKTNWNIGGKIEIKSGLEMVFTPIEKLNVKFGGNVNLLFERKVFNIADKGKYKGLFEEIDKEFGFKKLVPSVNLGLEYQW